MLPTLRLDPTLEMPPRRRPIRPHTWIGVAVLLSVLLHASLIGAGLLWARHRVAAPLIAKETPATVQLVMSPPGGETPPVAPPQPRTPPAPRTAKSTAAATRPEAAPPQAQAAAPQAKAVAPQAKAVALPSKAVAPQAKAVASTTASSGKPGQGPAVTAAKAAPQPPAANPTPPASGVAAPPDSAKDGVAVANPATQTAAAEPSPAAASSQAAENPAPANPTPPPQPSPPRRSTAQPSPPAKSPAQHLAQASAQPLAQPSAPPAPPPAPQATPPGDSKLQFDFANVESDTNALVTGDMMVPPSVDVKFHNRKPSYPLDAAWRGEQGAVVLLVHVTPEGLVAGIDVLRSSGFRELDHAAEDAVATWHFLPAVRDGHPIPAELRMGFEFALD